MTTKYKSHSLHTYKVWVSNSTSFPDVRARTAKEARIIVWKKIKDGWNYGWDRDDFIAHATTERIK